MLLDSFNVVPLNAYKNIIHLGFLYQKKQTNDILSTTIHPDIIDYEYIETNYHTFEPITGFKYNDSIQLFSHMLAHYFDNNYEYHKFNILTDCHTIEK